MLVHLGANQKDLVQSRESWKLETGILERAARTVSARHLKLHNFSQAVLPAWPVLAHPHPSVPPWGLRARLLAAEKWPQRRFWPGVRI